MAAWGFSVGNDPFPRTDLNKAMLSLLGLSISVSVAGHEGHRRVIWIID
jgi:hypothetical protein